MKGRGRMMSNNELDELRTRIDEVNLELLRLINERALLVQEIGRVKGSQGVYRFDPVRERMMLDKIKEHNDGPFDNSTITICLKKFLKQD